MQNKYLKTKIGEHNIAYKNNFSKVKNAEITVVFLCGYMSDMEGSKSECLYEFCTNNDLGYFAFDYSGHGSSSGEIKDGKISRWSHEAIHMIETHVNTPVVLVGSSMGGWISLLTALKVKNKVNGVLNIAGAPDFTEDLMFEKFTEEDKKEIDEKGEVIVYRGENEYCISKDFIEDGRKNLLLRESINIDCPVVLMHGAQDDIVPVETSMRVMEKLSSERVKVVIKKDSDHRMSSEEDLELLKKEVQELITVLC